MEYDESGSIGLNLMLLVLGIFFYSDYFDPTVFFFLWLVDFWLSEKIASF